MKLSAPELIKMLTDILGHDSSSKSSIQADYSRFRPKMTDDDARLFTSVKFLRDYIDKKMSGNTAD